MEWSRGGDGDQGADLPAAAHRHRSDALDAERDKKAIAKLVTHHPIRSCCRHVKRRTRRTTGSEFLMMRHSVAVVGAKNGGAGEITPLAPNVSVLGPALIDGACRCRVWV